MLLIAYYVVFMILGDLAAYAIGLVTELEFGGYVSLIVFLTLYFLFLWVALGSRGMADETQARRAAERPSD